MIKDLKLFSNDVMEMMETDSAIVGWSVGQLSNKKHFLCTAVFNKRKKNVFQYKSL